MSVCLSPVTQCIGSRYCCAFMDVSPGGWARFLLIQHPLRLTIHLVAHVIILCSSPTWKPEWESASRICSGTDAAPHIEMLGCCPRFSLDRLK